MMMDVIWLIAGLVLLIGGGDVLVRGAAGLARHMGLSTLVVGLTVVAFGTSAPEMAVNVLAAVRGSGGISFGNIIGSNIANIALVLGTSAVIFPLVMQPSIIKREIPMMLLATASVLIMANDGLLKGPIPSVGTNGAAPEAWGLVDAIDRSDGLLLLLLFAVFMYYTIVESLKQHQSDAYLAELAKEQAEEPAVSLPSSIVLLIGGIAGVIGGGHLTVEGAVGVAERLGISEAVIGLTAIAIGTSLPELATAVMAVMRGHTDIAVGNVVGSNIFNLLLVLSVTSSARSIGVPDGGQADLLMMAGLSLVLLPLAMSGQNRISRLEGALLVSVYVGYMSWRCLAETTTTPG